MILQHQKIKWQNALVWVSLICHQTSFLCSSSYYMLIQAEQQKDKKLLEAAKKDTVKYTVKVFCGGGKSRALICHNGKIAVPTSLQHRVAEWYHTTLCHPGMTRTEETIRQHFWWQTLRQDVQNMCSACDTCQRTKRTHSKYGHLPAKEAEAEPWDKLCVDMIGPYTMKVKGKKLMTLWCVTMIDPVWHRVVWDETCQRQRSHDSGGSSRANMAYTLSMAYTSHLWQRQRVCAWVTLLPWWPMTMALSKCKGTTVRNPQANAVLERIHQTLGNIIRTFQLQDDPYMDPADPWAGILSAAMFALRATYHTTLQATPAQLVCWQRCHTKHSLWSQLATHQRAQAKDHQP